MSVTLQAQATKVKRTLANVRFYLSLLKHQELTLAKREIQASLEAALWQLYLGVYHYFKEVLEHHKLSEDALPLTGLKATLACSGHDFNQLPFVVELNALLRDQHWQALLDMPEYLSTAQEPNHSDTGQKPPGLIASVGDKPITTADLFSLETVSQLLNQLDQLIERQRASLEEY